MKQKTQATPTPLDAKPDTAPETDDHPPEGFPVVGIGASAGGAGGL